MVERGGRGGGTPAHDGRAAALAGPLRGGRDPGGTADRDGRGGAGPALHAPPLPGGRGRLAARRAGIRIRLPRGRADSHEAGLRRRAAGRSAGARQDAGGAGTRGAGGGARPLAAPAAGLRPHARDVPSVHGAGLRCGHAGGRGGGPHGVARSRAIARGAARAAARARSRTAGARRGADGAGRRRAPGAGRDAVRHRASAGRIPRRRGPDHGPRGSGVHAARARHRDAESHGHARGDGRQPAAGAGRCLCRARLP